MALVLGEGLEIKLTWHQREGTTMAKISLLSTVGDVSDNCSDEEEAHGQTGVCQDAGSACPACSPAISNGW